MATGTLRDLQTQGMTPEEIAALVAQWSTAPPDPQEYNPVRQTYAQPLLNALAEMKNTPAVSADILRPQTGYVDRPGMVEQAPLNTIRNNSTGRTFVPTDMYGQPSQSAAAGPITDPTRGYVDTPAGRGMYMKADPLKVVLQNGQIVDLGRDTGAERARMKENLALDAQRANIAHTQASMDPAAAAEMERQKAVGRQQGEGASVPTPEEVDFYAAMAAKGDQSWRVGLGRSKEGAALIRAVDRRMPSLAKEGGQGGGRSYR